MRTYSPTSGACRERKPYGPEAMADLKSKLRSQKAEQSQNRVLQVRLRVQVETPGPPDGRSAWSGRVRVWKGERPAAAGPVAQFQTRSWAIEFQRELRT